MEKWKIKTKKNKNTETSLCGTRFCLGPKTKLCLLFIKLGPFLDIWLFNASNDNFSGLLVQELKYILLGIDEKIDNLALCHAI